MFDESLDSTIALDEIDPIEFLHQHRAEIAKKYPTFEQLRDYYNQFNSIEAALARVQTRIDAQQRELETVE